MRDLRPKTHLTPEQIDAAYERAERMALIECARRTSKTLFLKGGDGPDVPSTIRALLRASPLEAELIARVALPFTDLAAAVVAYDQWLTAALVAGVEYNYIAATVLRNDQVLVLYGCGTMDANPGISRLRAIVGTAVILAAWDTTHLWATEEPFGYADEMPMWSTGETVNIWLMPFLTKAGGERFVLKAVIAEPKGTGPVTK